MGEDRCSARLIGDFYPSCLNTGRPAWQDLARMKYARLSSAVVGPTGEIDGTAVYYPCPRSHRENLQSEAAPLCLQG